MITAALRAEIEQHLRQRIVAVSPLSAAHVTQIYRITLENRTFCVAKIAAAGMDLEAWMIGYLRERSRLPVPKVFYSNAHVIIMEFIEQHHGLDEQAQRHAATLLAELHKVRGDSYGLDRDTMIGSLPQPNRPGGDWIEFFVQQRLFYMAGEALKEGKVDKALMKRLEKLAGKLPGYLGQPQPPALIHGDVWSGNIIAGQGKIAAFLDPAIYYADPEIELAFIKALNTFGSSFFVFYNDLNPIRPGFFETRADIYALYPLLVHTRLFGISYLRRVQKILDRFV